MKSWNERAEEHRVRIEQGFDETASEVLNNLENTLGDVEEELLAMGRQIQEDIDRVARYINEGVHMNSLGELQSRGPRFDQLCVERQRLVQTINIVRGSFERKAGLR